MASYPEGFTPDSDAGAGFTPESRVTGLLRDLRTGVGRVMGPTLQMLPPSWREAANPVPRSATEAAIIGGTLAAGPLTQGAAKIGVPLAGRLAASPALARILGGTAGGAVGGYLDEGTLEGAGRGAVTGGISTATGEAIGKGVEFGRRISAGGKAKINEEAARRVADIAQTIEPEAGRVIAAAKKNLSPTLAGARTPAALQESVLGGSLQGAASGGMERAIGTIGQQAPNLRVTGPGLQAAYNAMPALAQDQLVGQIGPQGMTLQQAQAVRSWLGSQAFSQSPVGQGVGKVPQQKLWATVSQEIEGALGPQLAPLWQQANQRYGGLMMLQDALSGANAFTGGPNRIALNTPALQQYLSLNRQEARQRMGQTAADALVNAATGGGQIGTRDVLAPGFGGALDALRQVYGRGQGGAPQILGSALRTFTPNIGSQYTGRGPLQLPLELQQILDVALQRGATQLGQP